MVAFQLPRKPTLLHWLMVGCAIFGLFAAANGIGSIVAGKTVVQVGGNSKPTIIIAKDGFYDVAALCDNKASVVSFGVATELRDKEYVIQNGLEQVRYKATPGNGVAMRYYPTTVTLDDGQKKTVIESAPVEMTKSAVDCVIRKAR